jgi:hypothetical protein
MTIPDANGAPVETEATKVRPLQIHTAREVYEGLKFSGTQVYLAYEVDAAVQRLSEQLAEARREGDAERERADYAWKNTREIDAARIAAFNAGEAARSALAAERERGGRMEGAVAERLVREVLTSGRLVDTLWERSALEFIGQRRVVCECLEPVWKDHASGEYCTACGWPRFDSAALAPAGEGEKNG